MAQSLELKILIKKRRANPQFLFALDQITDGTCINQVIRLYNKSQGSWKSISPLPVKTFLDLHSLERMGYQYMTLKGKDGSPDKDFLIETFFSTEFNYPERPFKALKARLSHLK